MILDSLAFRVNNCFMNLSVISKRTKGEVIVIGAGIAGLAAAGVTDFAPSEYCLSKAQRDDTRMVLKNLISGG